MTESVLVTVPEACAILRCSRVTFYRMLRAGDFRITKVRSSTLISRTQLERYIARNTRKYRPEQGKTVPVEVAEAVEVSA